MSEKKSMTRYLTILEKSEKASYEVKYLIAKARKTHIIRETLIKHVAIVQGVSQLLKQSDWAQTQDFK